MKNIPDIFKLWIGIIALFLIGVFLSKPTLEDFEDFIPSEVMESDYYLDHYITTSKVGDYLFVARYKVYDRRKKYAMYFYGYLGNFSFDESERGAQLTRGSLDDL